MTYLQVRHPIILQGIIFKKRLNSTLAINRSTLIEDSELDPWFITGLSDAEGSFSVSVSKNSQLKSSWRILASFILLLAMVGAIVITIKPRKI